VGEGGAFKVQIPPGNDDPDAFLAEFRARSDARMRAAIAFGVQFVNPDGVAVSAMPGFYSALSRAEIDALIAYIRSRELEAHPYRFNYDPPVRE
jgi:mono/diheme cytochrome c family protein